MHVHELLAEQWKAVLPCLSSDSLLSLDSSARVVADDY